MAESCQWEYLESETKLLSWQEKVFALNPICSGGRRYLWLCRFIGHGEFQADCIQYPQQ